MLDNYLKHLFYAIEHKNKKEQERILRDLNMLGMDRYTVSVLIADYGVSLLK